jgi:peptidoglycan/LPS O-acetylase OafA/YrhL
LGTNIEHLAARRDPARPRTIEHGYRRELDGIRALAILAVMFFHAMPIMGGYGGYDFFGGLFGVDVFFVLSGYLITSLLVREFDASRHVRFGAFYMRRALRLLPALLLALLLAAGVYALIDPSKPRPFGWPVVAVVLYVANWGHLFTNMGVFTPMWSLAIEEQYYLVWPLVLVVAFRRGTSKRTLGMYAAAAAALVAGLRLATLRLGFEDFAAFSTFTRTDGVLLGSALALVLADPPGWLHRLLIRRVVPIVAAAVLLIGTPLVTSQHISRMLQGGLFVLVVCTAGLIGHVVLRGDGLAARLLAVRPLPYIGRISYGLYLFHGVALLFVTEGPFEVKGMVLPMAYFALSFAVAIASSIVVERPVNAFKHWFAPGRAPDDRDVVVQLRPPVRRLSLRLVFTAAALLILVVGFMLGYREVGRDPALSFKLAALQKADAQASAQGTELIDDVVAERGWPGKSLVGRRGAKAAIEIVREGDLAFRTRALDLMEQAGKDEVDPADVAKLQAETQKDRAEIEAAGLTCRDGKLAPDPAPTVAPAPPVTTPPASGALKVGDPC